jgi:sugar phosphate isomerase/epimerase
MQLSRRDFGKLAVAATSATPLAAKPGSTIRGVRIGAITYSFRALPSSASDILRYCTELGIGSVELMSEPAEMFAGAPPVPRAPGRNASPEQRETVKRAAAARAAWRLSASMDKYRELRALFEKAGVRIEIFKLPITPQMSGAECDYVFETAKALGAQCITMELPKDPALSKRAGEFGELHKIFIGYHNHTQVDEHSWETALRQSKYNSINLDVGHFTEAISKSPLPFIERNHGRITSFHLKDKKFGTAGGGNRPWGKGDTPLREVLRLMARKKYRWPANIELEYEIPGDSSVMREMRTCLEFCKEALTTS